MTKSVYSEIRRKSDACPFLVHAKSIIARYEKNDRIPALNKIANAYLKYLIANSEVGFSRVTVRNRVAALNKYYNFIHDNGFDNLYSAQTKFRPTILEEFMAILFRDILASFSKEIPSSGLNLGSVKAYANLYFYGKDFRSFAEKPTIGLNLKDQDFAIYRNITITTDDSQSVTTALPIVAVECKSYIDKTMLEGSVATAEKVKTGNPYAFFCMVSERYDVSLDVDPAYSRIDQIYVLRKSRRAKGKDDGVWKPIDEEVVLSIVQDVTRHLSRPWSDVEAKLTQTGKLI